MLKPAFLASQDAYISEDSDPEENSSYESASDDERPIYPEAKVNVSDMLAAESRIEGDFE